MTTFKHAGKIGDCIYALPAMRALGGGHLILLENRPGHRAYDTKALIPLLEKQDYISSIEVIDCASQTLPEPEANYSFLPFATNPSVKKQHLTKTFYEIVGLSPDLQDPLPWLSAQPVHVADIVVSRTAHHLRGDSNSIYARIPLDRSVFLGVRDEYERFSERFGPIPHIATPDLLMAAELISGCSVFVGNPGALLAIAVGLGKPCIGWNGMVKNATPFKRQLFPPETLCRLLT